MSIKEFIAKQQEDRAKAKENAAAAQQALEERVLNATADARALRVATRKTKAKTNVGT